MEYNGEGNRQKAYNSGRRKRETIKMMICKYIESVLEDDQKCSSKWYRKRKHREGQEIRSATGEGRRVATLNTVGGISFLVQVTLKRSILGGEGLNLADTWWKFVFEALQTKSIAVQRH